MINFIDMNRFMTYQSLSRVFRLDPLSPMRVFYNLKNVEEKIGNIINLKIRDLVQFLCIFLVLFSSKFLYIFNENRKDIIF